MAITGKVFGREETIYDVMEKAYEASTNASKSTSYNEHSIRDKYFPYIESFLPKTEKLLFQHISKYEDKNSKLLNTPYPLDIITFSNKGPDFEIIFKCTQINYRELEKDIDKVPKAKSAIENAAFKPLQTVLLLIIRYYLITKQSDKLKAIYYYYGYSIYWSHYHDILKSKGYAPRKETMIYTVNELTMKNILKKEGSVKEWIRYNVQTPIENDSSYERLANCRDEDIRRVLEAVNVNMRSKIKEVSSKYFINYENNDVIMESIGALDDEGTQRVDESVTSEAEVLAQDFTNRFYMSNINMDTVNHAVFYAKDASAKEIKIALESIKNNVPVQEIQKLYSSLFYLFLTSGDPRASSSNVKTFKFFNVMRDVFKKGNSINVNIVTIRELVNKWLEQSLNIYRVTNREATKTNYRRAIYFYFVLTVSRS